MLPPKHLPPNPLLAFKKAAPSLNFPKLDVAPQKELKSLGNQDNAYPNTAFQNLFEDSNTMRLTNHLKMNNRLSKQTNEKYLKGLTKQRNTSPYEQASNGPVDPKRLNNSFQIVKKNDSRENSRGRPYKTPVREYNIPQTISGSGNGSNKLTNQEKKETKTSNLTKIYNPPTNPSQSQTRKPNIYRVSSKKDRKKSKEQLPQMELKKPQSFHGDDPFLTMSFGNKEFQKALGIDIQQLLNNKGLNDEANGTSGNNINIIGNVNYENINFNFTFSKTESSEQKKEIKPQNLPAKSPPPKRKSIKARDKEKPVASDQTLFRSPYNETEMSFNKINIRDYKVPAPNNLTVVQNAKDYNVLRETPTFNLPLQYYKEHSQSECKEIFSPSELKGDMKEELSSKTSKVDPPSIYSNDFLLDDLMEDLKKNGLFKYVNDSVKNGTISLETEEKDKNFEKNLGKKESGKTKNLAPNKENRKNEKSLLIDFDDEDDSQEITLAKNNNNTQIANENNNNFKVIKYKNMEVLDLDDF